LTHLRGVATLVQYGPAGFRARRRIRQSLRQQGSTPTAATPVRIICREQVDGVDYAWVVIPHWDGETARRVRASELPPDLWDRIVWGVVKVGESVAAEGTISGDAQPPRALALQFQQ